MTKEYQLLRRAKLFRNALLDSERKSVGRILLESANYGIRKNRKFSDYFRLGFYRKSAHKPLDYIGSVQNRKWVDLTIDHKVQDQFLNKLNTQKILTAHGVKFPRIIAHFFGDIATVDNKTYPVRTLSDFSPVISDLLKDGAPSLFAKPVCGLRGGGVFRLTPDKDIAWVFEKMKGTEYLLQEEIRQHSAISEIYQNSVNTMRVVSCISPTNGVQIALARMRFGCGGAEVDNVSLGGLFALVDLETGCLRGPGVRQLKFGGGTFPRHPDTGVTFDGFRIPFFEESFRMIHTAAQHLRNPVVGWDVAFTDDGPLLLEANQRPDSFGDELVSGPYIRNPVLGPFILEITDGHGL